MYDSPVCGRFLTLIDCSLCYLLTFDVGTLGWLLCYFGFGYLKINESYCAQKELVGESWWFWCCFLFFFCVFLRCAKKSRKARVPESEASTSYATMLAGGCYRPPDVMVTHNWSNKYLHLVAAIFSEVRIIFGFFASEKKVGL